MNTCWGFAIIVLLLQKFNFPFSVTYSRLMAIPHPKRWCRVQRNNDVLKPCSLHYCTGYILYCWVLNIFYKSTHNIFTCLLTNHVKSGGYIVLYHFIATRIIYEYTYKHIFIYYTLINSADKPISVSEIFCLKFKHIALNQPIIIWSRTYYCFVYQIRLVEIWRYY